VPSHQDPVFAAAPAIVVAERWKSRCGTSPEVLAQPLVFELEIMFTGIVVLELENGEHGR
jgi:hypothetical protein